MPPSFYELGGSSLPLNSDIRPGLRVPDRDDRRRCGQGVTGTIRTVSGGLPEGRGGVLNREKSKRVGSWGCGVDRRKERFRG